MRFLRVPMPRTRGLLYCSETVDICAWRTTLRWCRGTTSGRQCSQAARNVRIFNVTCTRRLMAWLEWLCSSVKPSYSRRERETLTSWPPMTKNSQSHSSIQHYTCTIRIVRLRLSNFWKFVWLSAKEFGLGSRSNSKLLYWHAWVVITTVTRNFAVTNKRRGELSATAELLVELLAIKIMPERTITLNRLYMFTLGN